MKFITGTLCFALLVLSTSSQYCRDSCTPANECAIIRAVLGNKNVEDSMKEDLKNYMRSTLDCHCYIKGKPAIICPFDLPDRFSLDGKKIKRMMIPKREQKKKLLDICGKVDSNKIARGGKNTEINDYPWLALLQFERQGSKQLHIGCGGVLISDQHVLTTASCVQTSGKLVSVILGDHDTETEKDCMHNGYQTVRCNQPVINVGVENITIHEDYFSVTSHISDFVERGDLAIIKLQKRIIKIGPQVRPICLPQNPKLLKRQYEVAGWRASPSTENLRKKQRAVLSYTPQCMLNDIDLDPEDFICVRPNQAGESCIVDNGGPLMAFEQKSNRVNRMTVFGVSTKDNPCGSFTNLFTYVPWIESIIFS